METAGEDHPPLPGFIYFGDKYLMGMAKNLTKVNISDEHRHMIRLYMVHKRLPNMQEAVGRLIETALKAEGTFTYDPAKELKARRTVSAKAG